MKNQSYQDRGDWLYWFSYLFVGSDFQVAFPVPSFLNKNAFLRVFGGILGGEMLGIEEGAAEVNKTKLMSDKYF